MWYNKYLNIPYKHLGNNPKTGIDCLNLCLYIYKEELGITVPIITSDYCNIIDDDWYQKSNEQLLENGVKLTFDGYGWEKVSEPKPFDILLMSIGSTNVTNHCSLYVETNKILQIMNARKSWVSTYGRFYQQYTTGIYRWKNLTN